MAKILVVEEEMKVRKLVYKILSRKYPDCEIIEEANDGAIGLELIKATNFDLVLTDWRMKEMDGDEMIAAAREAGCMPPRIIVMTAGNLSECWRRFYMLLLPADVYSTLLQKPFENAKLEEVVFEALAWHPPR